MVALGRKKCSEYLPASLRMKKRDQIKRILVDQLGFKNLEAYRKWIDEVMPSLRPDKERIALLSPDIVDCRDFWSVCDELFGTDPVCNTAVGPSIGSFPYAIETAMDANRMNLHFAKSLGVTAFLDENAHARLKVLEIGPGYGSLKNYIETHTNHVYTGVDVVPRVPGVLPSDRDGTLPRALVEKERGKFSYVIASNVLQHFSERQRTQAFQDALALLHDDGILIFNLTIDTAKIPAYARDDEGNAWAVHYGQYTPIPKAGLIYDQLSDSFDILYVTQRHDGIFNFVAQKS